MISYIVSEIAGIHTFNLISILRFIWRRSIIWKHSIYTIHPPWLFATVEFIELIDSFNIIVVIQRRVSGRNLYSILFTNVLLNIKHSFTCCKFHACRWKNPAVIWNKFFFCFLQLVHVVKHSSTINRYGTCSRFPGIFISSTANSKIAAEKEKTTKDYSKSFPYFYIVIHNSFNLSCPFSLPLYCNSRRHVNSPTACIALRDGMNPHSEYIFYCCLLNLFD